MASIDPESLVRSPWLAGAMGAIVALHGVPGASWMERLFNVVSGVLIAGYLSPAVAEYFSLHTVSMQSATAFVCGLFGLNVCASIVQWVRTADIGALLPWRR